MAGVTGRDTRVWVALASVVTAAALIFLAVFLGHQDVDRVNKLVSILQVLLAIVGVAIAAAGLLLSWRMGRGTRTSRTRQVIRADDTSRINAQRSQWVSGGSSGDVDQEITGHGGSQIDARDAQWVERDDR
jgi:hypothetical protein